METKLETFSKRKFCINSNVFHTPTSTFLLLIVKNMLFIVTSATPQCSLQFVRTVSLLITGYDNLK